ncbi:hypothetical protein BH24PSE1_BH24PSE1_07120 [soil metagenome]
MDDPVKTTDESSAPRSRRPRWLVWLIVPLLLLGAYSYWTYQRAQEEREQQLDDEGFTLVRVLSSTFTNASELKVGNVSGTFQITTRDAGWGGIFPSSQRVRVPFSIDYQINVSQLDSDDYRWDPASRTLVVRLPPVQVTAPNIDESRVQVLDRDGIWISRGAQDKLNSRLTNGAINQARQEAANSQRKASAEANAKRVVSEMLRTPLAAAGLSDVEVVALGSAETPANTDARERWDVSRSIEDVLRERQQAGQD